MMTRTRKALFVLVVLSALALLGGVAWANVGYGVGDGTGPVGVQPLDGTGEQYQGPPDEVSVVPATVTSALAGYGVGDGTGPVGEEPRDGTGEQHRQAPMAVTTATGDCTGDQLRDRDRLQDQDQLQEQLRDQERLQEQDQLQLQDQDQLGG